MALLTYSPDDVDVLLAGLIPIRGFVDGTFIQVEKEVTPYSYQSAMDGETSRTFKFDQNYKVTITLAHSSPSNSDMNAMHALDIATQLGKLPFMIRDRNGTTSFFSPNAWIENYPTVTYSRGVEARTWVLRCTEGVLTVGGNDNSDFADFISLLSNIGSFSQ